MTARDLNPVQRAESLGPLITENADEGERDCRLPSAVASALAREGLYRIGAPVNCGGEEADPITQIETIEAVSRFDGSAGWNLMIGIENFGLIAPGCTGCMHLIQDPMVVMCSSTAAVGRAERDGEGYRVSGRWQFVSGCHNSQVFGATVRLYENGEELRPFNMYALIPASEFHIEETWLVGGMRGSGSHDVVVNDVWVPDAHIVVPLGAVSSDQPLLRFPLGARLAYNKVGVATGIARAALDAFVELAEGKVPRFSSGSLRERPAAQRAIAEAELRLRSARAFVMEQVAIFWERAKADAHITTRERAIFQLACSDAVRAACQGVELVTEAAGTSANFKAHPLERANRDVKVVRQHVTVASHHIDDAGRVLLGLDPKGAMLAGMKPDD